MNASDVSIGFLNVVDRHEKPMLIRVEDIEAIFTPTMQLNQKEAQVIRTKTGNEYYTFNTIESMDSSIKYYLKNRLPLIQINNPPGIRSEVEAPGF